MSKSDSSAPPAYDDVLTAKAYEADKHFYEDKFVKITREGIEIKCYYFPTTQNKFIPFSAFKSLYYESQGCMKKCCYIKSWGMAFSNVWWACDMRRQCPIGDKSGYNVVIDVGESPMKGFSVTDISSFLTVLKAHLPSLPIKPELPF